MLPYLTEYFATPLEIQKMGFPKQIVEKYKELCERASRIVVTSTIPVEQFEELLAKQAETESSKNSIGWLQFDLLMGFFEVKRGVFSRAQNRYSRIIAQSTDMRVRNGLALLFLNAWKKYGNTVARDNAESFLKDIVQESKDHYSSRVNLAAIHFSKNQLDHAERLLWEAIKINPETGVAYFNLAILTKKMKPKEMNKVLDLLDRASKCKYPYEFAPIVRYAVRQEMKGETNSNFNFASAA